MIVDEDARATAVFELLSNGQLRFAVTAEADWVGTINGMHIHRGAPGVDGLIVVDLLSGGAREQLSVIVRLGLAEVLGDGERLPVVLDDALVNSDPARLARMLKVLYRAAKRLQVVVFTCHEVAFDGLGATRVFRLGGRPREVSPPPPA